MTECLNKDEIKSGSIKRAAGPGGTERMRCEPGVQCFCLPSQRGECGLHERRMSTMAAAHSSMTSLSSSSSMMTSLAPFCQLLGLERRLRVLLMVQGMPHRTEPCRSIRMNKKSLQLQSTIE